MKVFVDKGTQVAYTYIVSNLRTICVKGAKMDIRELRETLHLSQKEFAEKLGIPIGSIRNWEQGKSEPADYLIEMMEHRIRRDSMVNVQTIKFMKMLDELAALSENGFVDWETLNHSKESGIPDNKILYSSKHVTPSGYYKVICDVTWDAGEWDIVGFYDNIEFDSNVEIGVNTEEPMSIDIKFINEREYITIMNGEWYFG